MILMEPPSPTQDRHLHPITPSNSQLRRSIARDFRVYGKQKLDVVLKGLNVVDSTGLNIYLDGDNTVDARSGSCCLVTLEPLRRLTPSLGVSLMPIA